MQTAEVCPCQRNSSICLSGFQIYNRIITFYVSYFSFTFFPFFPPPYIRISNLCFSHHCILGNRSFTSFTCIQIRSHSRCYSWKTYPRSIGFYLDDHILDIQPETEGLLDNILGDTTEVSKYLSYVKRKNLDPMTGSTILLSRGIIKSPCP